MELKIWNKFWLLAFLCNACLGQQTIAPFKTQQANTVFYVNMGNTTLNTIQKTVTAACAYSSSTVVEILPGSNPSDTIGGLTSACTTTSIADRRGTPPAYYSCDSGGCTQTASDVTASQISNLITNSLFSAPLYLFSDSQGVGVGATVDKYSIEGRMQGSHGGDFHNISAGGNQSTDWSVTTAQDLPYGQIPAAPNLALPLSVIQGGVNNYNACGVTAACLDAYTRSISMALSWAGTTSTQAHRVFPATMTLAGGFNINTSTYGMSVALSAAPGSTATGSVVSTGNPIGIDYVVSNANTGQLSCTIDGGAAQVLNEYPISPATIGPNHTFSFFRSEIAATAGTHAVVCTAANNTGTGNFSGIVAYDSIPVGVTSQLPTVVMSNAPGIGGSNSAATNAFNAQVTVMYNQYVSEGLNLRPLFDFNTISNSLGANGYGDTTYAPCPGLGSGGLHFNNCIHLAVAQGYATSYPDIFTLNAGPTTGGAYQSFGGTGIPDTSYYSSCNLNGSFNPTTVNNCGYYVYPGVGMDFGAYSSAYPGFGSVGTPYLRFSQGNICFENTAYPGVGNPFKLQSQWGQPTLCMNDNNLYGWLSTGGTVNGVPSGSVVSSNWRPWQVSHDNVKSFTSSGVFNFPLDGIEIGPLTADAVFGLPVCKNWTGFSSNPWIYVRRIGNDGHNITFTANALDTTGINGAASYVWSASEPDSGILRCNAGNVSNEFWAFTPSTVHPTSTTTLNVSSSLLSANGTIGIGNFSNLVVNSSLLTNASWIQNTNPLDVFTVVGGQSDPSGGNTAVKLTTGTTAGNSAIYFDSVGTTTAGQPYCVTAWVKGDVGGEANFTLSASGFFVTLPALTTSWTRYSYTMVGVTSGGFRFGQTLFTASPITAYLAQPLVTSGSCPALPFYVPTTSSPITSLVAIISPFVQPNTLQVTNKLTNGAGIQIATANACAIPSGVGSDCTVSFTLDSPEPDTSYQVSGCTLTGSTGQGVANSAGTLSTTGFSLHLTNLIASGGTGGVVSCLVSHP